MKNENEKSKRRNEILIIIVFGILILLTFLTQFYGSTDIADYSDTAKYFAGDYPAKIRNSHSYLFGFIHSPLVRLTHSYVSFKITSLIFLALIIYSVYYLSGKNRKALWLMLLSPAVWYMSPWISPIQLTSLLFLWGFYFIEKYDKIGKLKYLFYSGIFVGLAWAIWDTIFFFGFFLAIAFLCNKKLSHSICFVIFLLIGLLPRLILDQYLFNFPFYTMMKGTMSGFINALGGIYQSTGSDVVIITSLVSLALLVLALPLYYWTIYKAGFFKENKKVVIFLSLCLLLIFSLPQLRYVLVFAPIIILLNAREMNEKQFRRQIIFSIIVILLFIFPYIIQIDYSIIDKLNGADIGNLFEYLIARGG